MISTPVVARLQGQIGASGKIVDLSLKISSSDSARGLKILMGACRAEALTRLLVKSVPARVQDLQGDLAPLVMNGRGDDPVAIGHLGRRVQLCRVVGHTALAGWEKSRRSRSAPPHRRARSAK